MLKYLRIAVTAFSLTVCVLLVALWVRSYRIDDELVVHVSEGRLIGFSSITGRIMVGISDSAIVSLQNIKNTLWQVNSLEISDDSKTWWGSPNSKMHWRFALLFASRMVTVPHWLVVSLFATLVVIPWLPWSKRFSLRTLLIATTLIAVGLGLIISTS